MSGPGYAPSFDGSFPHSWTAEVLPNRPMILPSRHYVYPAIAEEVEKGALEVLVQPGSSATAATTRTFLATCALGFRDDSTPSGLWSMPHPDWLCAVSGGYAYLIHVNDPAEFKMLEYRPVLQVLPVPEKQLLLFIGHHAILAWGRDGEAWQSDRLSWEGINVEGIEGEMLRGVGWDMMTDKDVPFELDLATGKKS